MSLKLEFSRQAKETYAAIQSQLYNRFGQAVLEKFERKTVKTLDSILQSPLMFKSITDNLNIRKGLIHKNCSVFYEVKNGKMSDKKRADYLLKFSIFNLALSDRLNNYGLDNNNGVFKLTDVEREDSLVISTWSPATKKIAARSGSVGFLSSRIVFLSEGV